MSNIKGAKVAILATNGFEKSELFEPMRQLKDAGAKVTVISPESGTIKSWDVDNWGDTVDVDLSLADARVEDFDALVLPGGQINPDLLRVNDRAIDFIRDFEDTGKVLAAICHAPWLLIEAGVVMGRDMTSYKSISLDMKNAGANWIDEEVVVDKGMITSRNPGDLDAFCAKIIEEINEGRHNRPSG